MRSVRCLLPAALLTFAAWTTQAAAILPAGFTETLVASGLTNPVSMAFAPDGRLFVCLQGGTVRVIKDSVLLPTPFLTLTVDAAGERGLLAIAFDPNFAVNQHVYVNYTASTPAIHNRISRFTANGDVAVPGSETFIFELDNVATGFHMGGAMHFGADGKLYIAVGDNERPGGPRSNSQTLANLFGKMLRINPDGNNADVETVMRYTHPSVIAIARRHTECSQDGPRRCPLYQKHRFARRVADIPEAA